jgi:polar amino acid transport system substrate-binding protein
MRGLSTFGRTAAALAVVALVSLPAAIAPASGQDARTTLAPSGSLRVGLYPGTPTSILDPKSPAPRGVGYEIGKTLADKLGVPYQPVVFGKNAEVLEAVSTGTVDMAFTNATAARAKLMDFAQPYLEIELGYLVPKGGKIASIADIDAKGVRVGVTQGSTSDSTLSRDLKNAEIVRSVTLKDGIDALTGGKIDAYATNKATLFEMADQLPGSKVLDGRWGLERHAIAIPKGREAGLAYLRSFTDTIKKDGVVRAAVSRAGLRGTTPE